MKRIIPICAFVILFTILSVAQTSTPDPTGKGFCNKKLIFDGKQKPVDTTGHNDAKIIRAGGALNIGIEMELGDYILQIIVTDELANKKKYETATGFVQFEVVEKNVNSYSISFPYLYLT